MPRAAMPSGVAPVARAFGSDVASCFLRGLGGVLDLVCDFLSTGLRGALELVCCLSGGVGKRLRSGQLR